ncbi:MAG: TIR domain-containing protein [Leptolyngbya sp. SIO1D8]|nr:TIR domain-containing protein [Leptolyngbya sp. SIO1D8]
MTGNPVSIFISYARKDEALMQDLKSHLSFLTRQQLIRSWDDGCITPGEEWEPQIKANLAKAQIILLLISVDFINSEYCYDVELTKAIARHQAGNACVIPIILRSCMWMEVQISDMRLGDLQALPKNAKPISQWGDRDEALTSIAQGIFSKIQQLRQAEAEAIERQREAAERQRKQTEYYSSGQSHLQQGNYDQAITDFRQAAQYGHPEARQMLVEAERKRQAIEDDLSSEKGIDYTRLRDLLKAGDWKAADKETYEVMLRAVGKKIGEWFTTDELVNFPCVDLLTIDRLWVKYSQGQFGFSVQEQVYVECGAKLDGQYPGDKIWKRFGEKVGWRVENQWIYYRDVTFDADIAPMGHLPVLFPSLLGLDWFVCVVVFSRIQTCKV